MGHNRVWKYTHTGRAGSVLTKRKWNSREKGESLLVGLQSGVATLETQIGGEV